MTLHAPVARDASPLLLSPTDVCNLMDISEQTLRNWVTRGLSQHGAERRPLYRAHEVTIWRRYYRHLQRVQGTAPRLVRMEDALLHACLEEIRIEAVPGDHYVIVPLGWDHPGREEALRRAAAGRPCDPPEDDDSHDGE